MMDATQEIMLTPLQFLPLTSNNNIMQGNALLENWNNLLPADECSYVIGNPPFVGAMEMSSSQRDELKTVFRGLKGVGELDYVTGWYEKAALYIQDYPIKGAFVSTSSINQGLPVGIFWKHFLIDNGFHIDFAYQTFIWDNEAPDKAHVHVVIIGFSKVEARKKILFEKGIEGRVVENINGYLVEGDDVFITERSKPISNVPYMSFGSMPRTKGFTVMPDQLEEYRREDPSIVEWVRPFIGANEFLKGKDRFCFWLVGADESVLTAHPIIQNRVEQVRNERLLFNVSF